jgi:hypothetical protein
MHSSIITKLACALLGLCALHCGSDSDSSGGTGGAGSGGASATDYPTDSSQAGIEAFLAAGSYTTSTWTSETSAPREATSITSPHGRVRVWLNAVLEASHAAGEGSVGGTPLDQNSMSVKELYDDADAIVGHAVILRTGTTSAESDTTYYCVGPAARCAETSPVYGAGAVDCAGCHGGLVFTGIPQ